MRTRPTSGRSRIHSASAYSRDALGHQLEHGRFDVAARQRRLAVEQADVAVDAHGRPRLRREIQRRGAAGRGEAQQALDAARPAVSARALARRPCRIAGQRQDDAGQRVGRRLGTDASSNDGGSPGKVGCGSVGW